MGCTIIAYAWDSARGVMAELQTVPTLPGDFKGESTCAEIAVHPSGKFVYGSNRGHDSIAIFSRDLKTGELTPRGHAPSGGKTPRYFGIDSAGRWLLAAHQGTDNITVFSIDPETGQLTRTPTELKVGAPVCIVFVPL
jgi:6-phosphogluconolactonase